MKNSKTQKEEIKKIIENRYPKSSAFNKALGTSYYESSSEIEIEYSVNLSSTKTKYDTLNYKILFAVMIILLLIQVALKFDKLIHIAEHQNELYLFGVQIIIAGLFYFAGFVKKFEKHSITINDIGIHFSEYVYSNFGLRYKRRLVYWDEILEYGILSIPAKYNHRYNIIIGTTYMEILKMDVTNMEILPEDYISLMNEQIRNHNKRLT